MRKIIIITAVFQLVLFSGNLKAQESDNSRFHIMAVPQFLIKNGLRIDVDYKIKDDRWLIISPYVYLVDNSSNESTVYVNSLFYHPEFVKLTGAGLGLAQRHILNSGATRTKVYMEYGVLFRYYNFEMDDFLWKSYTENNLTFQRLEHAEYDMTVTNMGINCQFGVQHEVFDNFLIDIFVGAGMRYSKYDKPIESTVKFNNSMIDYGFTGTMVTGGIRIGVAL